MNKYYCYIREDSPFMPNEKGYVRSLIPNSQGYYMFYGKRSILIPKDYIIFQKKGEKDNA